MKHVMRITLMAIIIFMLAISAACAPKQAPNANQGSEAPEQSGEHVQQPENGANPQESGNNNNQGQEEDSVRDMLEQLSTAEKIGQLVIVGVEGTAPDDTARQFIESYHVGGFIFYKNNISDTKQAVAFFNELKKMNAHNRVPLLLSVDEEGGRVSRMPEQFQVLPAAHTIGASGSAELASGLGTIVGKELAGFGLNMDFAPVMDINSNPDNPVIGSRSFGNDAKTVSEMGVAMLQGIKQEGVIPVVKHFPGHGDTSVDSHLGLPVVEHDMERLRKLELVPFAKAIEEGADVVMVAHLLMPKLDAEQPASFSKAVIHDVLREELGFEGVVVTDDMTMGAIVKHYDIGEAAVKFIQGGGNIVLVGHERERQLAVIDALTAAVKHGDIPAEVLDERVYTILKLKEKYGLKDDPASGPDVEAINEEITDILTKYKIKTVK
ncbi:beta-N-acetylhexosaminidase [Paenibacillus woosongensis]|uniref:Beta-N-acetylhexosaminidase n=1 Tax=Paenibacillus woosongensis TaxID=307580 RepID=A0A7X3CLV5_9BACL|nr:beta-N-acetylhexosaminidase [Paenibacillus woosongensis]MUG44129.1 beta-N-acetylhexosaminidase [Paenibacillus woosongensis]